MEKIIIEFGGFIKEIKNLMSLGKEAEAYEVLNEFNNKLSDYNGNVLEMEDILSLTIETF